MASKILTAAVKEAPDGSWTFQCPGFADSPCSDPDAPPFHSTGWPTKATATARGQEHLDEHKDPSQPMSGLEDFRAKHKLTRSDDGRYAYTTKDL